MTTETRATIADLYRVLDDQKAELVNGEVQLMSPTGKKSTYAAGEVVASLRQYSHETRSGWAVQDNAGFMVNLPHRQSLSPDASFYTGKDTANSLDFFESAPIFAVEVRSKGDYGATAERAMATKRADYFAAGTQVVWDVDLQSPDVVRVYHADAPDQPTIYRRGEIAAAEPAVPGWTMPVDDLFPPDWLT
ncbi:MAG: Uma2 family endonuclease [Chloroflexota bacterium]|nr:Uma2 family endonuclease [Chloroflexota bacterium]